MTQLIWTDRRSLVNHAFALSIFMDGKKRITVLDTVMVTVNASVRTCIALLTVGTASF